MSRTISSILVAVLSTGGILVAGCAGERGAAPAVYDKSRYDASQNNQWLGPTKTRLGTLAPTFSLTLSPWSMTLVNLN